MDVKEYVNVKFERQFIITLRNICCLVFGLVIYQIGSRIKFIGQNHLN